MSSPQSSFQKAAVATACLAVAMLMLDISVVNTALSSIARGLSTNLSGLQWVLDAYTLPLAALVLTGGSLADRFGRRRLFIIGLAIFSLASLVCGVASAIGTLVAARAVQGTGAAVLFASALGLIGQVSQDREQRVKAMAAFGATIGIAFAIGPFIGGVLTQALGWQAIFLINVPIGAAAITLSLRTVPEGRDPHARRPDVPGQIALIGALFLLVLGLLRGNQAGWSSPLVIASLIAAAGLLAAWCAIENRSPTPMLPLRLLADRHFAGAQIAAFAMAASFFSVFFYITVYLQEVAHRTPIQTGLVYLPGTTLMFVISVLVAQHAHRLAPQRLASAGLLLTAAGITLMLLTDARSSWTILLPGVFVTSIGLGIFNPAASDLALSALPPEQVGLAAGANDTFRQVGVAVGIAALGTLVPSSTIGGSPAAYVTGFHHTLIAASLIAATGGLLTAQLLRSTSATAQPAAPPIPPPRRLNAKPTQR